MAWRQHDGRLLRHKALHVALFQVHAEPGVQQRCRPQPLGLVLDRYGQHGIQLAQCGG
jgi:hypothetical protein